MEKIELKTIKEICLRNKTFHLVIIILLVLAVYANSLPNKFNFDDPSLLLDNPAVHGLAIKNVKAIFASVPNSVEYLPVRDLTYALDYEIWVLRPWGYHLSNLLYYLAACLALYAFLTKLLSRFGEENPAAAFFAALLFALHPVHVESVAGIAQRKDVVMGLFFFLSLWSFLVYKERDGQSKKVLGWYILAVFFFLLAFLSKTQAVVLPLMVWLINHVYKREEPASALRRWAETIIFFLVAITLTAAHLFIYQKMGVIDIAKTNFVERGFTAIRAVFYYCRMLIFPYPSRILYEFRISRSFFEPAVILSLAGMAVLVYFIGRGRKTQTVLSFAGAWYLLSLAPVVGFIPTAMLIAERYLFLPSLGFCLALGWIFHRLVISPRRQTALAAGLLLVMLLGAFALLDINRNRDWKNMETLLLADLKLAPDSIKINQALGRYYFKNGRYPAAFYYLQKTRELSKESMDYEFHLALFLYQQGKYNDALMTLESLGGEKRDWLDINYLYGRIYQARGDYSKARESYLRALESRRMMGIFFKSNAKAALEELEGKGKW